MENYITLFNFNYVPQGLTMFFSLKKYLPDSRLWVVCMDKKVELFLKKKKIKDLEIIPLKNVENEKLLKIKKKRKFIEYCWTLTPFLPDFIFKRFKKIKRVTYIDADIFFFKNPKFIINEFIRSKKSVLLTEHGFHYKKDYSSVSGKFCVQYMIFNNNQKVKKILKWWQTKCIDWCHDYPDKGRLGDQKYLDLWPKLFKNSIHISKNKKFFQGPWTYNRFRSKDRIIYHFHGLKIKNFNILVYNRYGFTNEIIKNIYIPYCQAIKNTLIEVNKNFDQINDIFFEIKILIYKFRCNFFDIKVNNNKVFDLNKLK